MKENLLVQTSSVLQRGENFFRLFAGFVAPGVFWRLNLQGTSAVEVTGQIKATSSNSWLNLGALNIRSQIEYSAKGSSPVFINL
jgi:hypothetical protein